MKISIICPHCGEEFEVTSIHLNLGAELLIVAIGFIAGVIYAGGI